MATGESIPPDNNATALSIVKEKNISFNNVFIEKEMDTPMNSSSFEKNLLAWYSTAKRDLPWRRTTDPYRILVSEMMLQQTQVDRVIPKYKAFLHRFPTVQDLAHASPG